jgi:hypothetical protein
MNRYIFRYRLAKLKTTPFPLLIKFFLSKINKKVMYYYYMIRDHLYDTRIVKYFPSDQVWYFADVKKLDLESINKEYASELVRMWKSHRFDILGSGWIRNGFLDNASGIQGYRYTAPIHEIDKEGNWLEKILNKRNVLHSKSIWRLVSKEYMPIDWQKDFKSGYRWDAKTWYCFQKWADSPGGDIIVPWELSRLQHFPRMAIFAELFPEKREELAGEFRNQCLDFFTQNPPRMGVNSRCTMDLAIRTANIALAYSLFCTGGYIFDEAFTQIFLRSLFEYCRHIMGNLERTEFSTHNHYLADIVGLLFGASLLPPSKQRKRWICFSQKEIKKEILKQFYPEGSNFEASTTYHHLSSNMAVYAVALILNMQEEDIPQEITDRLFGMAKFMDAVTRPDLSFSQIGDNDNGIFFRLSPVGILFSANDAKARYQSLADYMPEQPGEPYFDENVNDGRPTISALSALFETDDFSKIRHDFSLEYSMVRMLSGGRTMHSTWKPSNLTTLTGKFASRLKYHKETEIGSNNIPLLGNLQRIDFLEFGIFLFRSDTLYLLVNATKNRQNGNNGHSHNDKLSFELFINNECLYEDPGIYVYTPFPEIRNKYRSVYAHNTIHSDGEQNEFLQLFSMKNQSHCSILSLSGNSIWLSLEYREIIQTRKFIIENYRIVIIDDSNRPFINVMEKIPVTTGYGKLKF